jgi:hypothetical protein
MLMVEAIYILHSFNTSLHNDYQGQMSFRRHYKELVSTTNDYLSIFKALLRTNSTYGERVLPSLSIGLHSPFLITCVLWRYDNELGLVLVLINVLGCFDSKTPLVCA